MCGVSFTSGLEEQYYVKKGCGGSGVSTSVADIEEVKLEGIFKFVC